MKKTLLTLAALACATIMSAQSLFVGTYNLRQKNSDDSIEGNVWGTRAKMIAEQINFYEPDIFGTQELFYGQLQDIKRQLPDYTYIGVAREDGKKEGEHSAIFYNKTRFELLKSGNFWISQTPDVAGSMGWDAACTRICTWGQFSDRKSGFKFYYFNVHLDHVGVTARREGMKLVLSKMKEVAGENGAAILTGDFNVSQKEEAYDVVVSSGLLKDTYVAADYRFAPNGTFNDFNPNRWTDERIDHIFVTKKFNVRRYAVITDSYWTPNTETSADNNASGKKKKEKYTRRNISDHYPVFAKITFNK